MNWLYQIIRTTPACLFLFCLLILPLCASYNVEKTVVARCIDQERDALLKFKHHIQSDNCGLMSSWGNPNKPNCCTWKGVSCSNQSGHVVGLRLSGDTDDKQWGCLDSPTLSPSLGELKHLKYLDLSSNYFYGMIIPSSIGSLINLVYLNLADSGFSGNIPHQLANLTRVTSFDLSNNNGLSANSLNWLSRLTSLRDINVRGTDLSMVKDWFRIIGSLPLLEVLKMDDCQLSTPPLSSSSSFLQSANLRVISLSGNGFNSFSSFKWLFNTSNNSSVQRSLKYLDLSNNLLKGPIPDAIENLEYLTYIDISRNLLSRTIPDGIGELDYLTHLDLSWNSLSRTIPHAIGNLEFLRYLDLSQNSLSGIIPDAISNLQSLLHLDLSNNSLSGQIASTIYFSGYLGTMHSLSYLNLSYNRLDGSIPSLLGGGASSLSHLDLSNNQLEGAIPSSIANLEYLGYLDLSRNNLTGDIPCKLEITKPPYFADFSYNDLSGSIPKHLSYLGPDSFKGNTNFRTDEIQGLCDKDDDKIDRGLYVSIVLGFYTGFWAFCGILIVKSSWRHAYFRFFNHIKDKIYEIVVVNLIDQIYVIVVVSLARYRRNSQVYR